MLLALAPRHRPQATQTAGARLVMQRWVFCSHPPLRWRVPVAAWGETGPEATPAFLACRRT
eukprot:9301561-Lingulodinium_polyedra.AAC.1